MVFRPEDVIPVKDRLLKVFAPFMVSVPLALVVVKLKL